MELCFDREFEFDIFAMGKWLRIACFPTSVFLIINVFPYFLQKKGIEQLLHQSLEPTLSVHPPREFSDTPPKFYDKIATPQVNDYIHIWAVQIPVLYKMCTLIF